MAGVIGRSLIIVLLSSGGSGLLAQGKSPLPEHYVLGDIRVFYAVDGNSAVPAADNDSTGTPDHVEDVAKQVWAAHRLFCGVLGFPDPIKSDRYPRVTCIQIGIRDRSELDGLNGVAFDESEGARRIPEGKPGDRALIMDIGRNVAPSRNVTPAHELFHLIQYGATYFKNGWFLEGQARWSEHAMSEGGIGEVQYPPDGPWPQTSTELTELYAMRYDAEYVLWNPIAMQTDPRGVIPESPVVRELATSRYSDGSAVLKDFALTGAKIMRDILIEFGKMDDIAFKELRYEKWTEDNQKSSKNNSYLYQSIMDVLRRR